MQTARNFTQEQAPKVLEHSAFIFRVAQDREQNCSQHLGTFCPQRVTLFGLFWPRSDLGSTVRRAKKGKGPGDSHW